MHRRRKNYEKNKYSKGKFCLVCLLLHGKRVKLTNHSTHGCCVSCVKTVRWWHRKHPAESDAIRLQDGPREIPLTTKFWLLVDEALSDQ